jgi:hypothetical protein
MIRNAAAATIICLTMSVPALVRADEARPMEAKATAAASEIGIQTATTPLTYPALSGREWAAGHRRPAALPGLYASFAALQLFDAYSTQRAISGGATEANPVMKNVVGNRAAFWSVKVAATVAPMMAAERLWKRNKVAAIAVMAASNGVMAAVAAHNASVLKSQR